MKQDEIKPCALCKKGVMHNNGITFFKVRIEHFMVNLDAVRRQHGLEMLTGHPALARVFGTNEDIARKIYGKTAVLCQDCAIDNGLAQIEERIGEHAEAEADSK